MDHQKFHSDEFKGCPQFADNRTIQAEGRTSFWFHLSWFPFRFVSEHEGPSFLLVYASILRLPYPFAFSCICCTGDNNNSRYNIREITRRHQPRKGLKWWGHSLIFDTGHKTISCSGNFEEQSSSIQDTLYKPLLKNTSNIANAQCNRCKTCWNSCNLLPRLRNMGRWNKQQTQSPTIKRTHTGLPSWSELKLSQLSLRQSFRPFLLSFLLNSIQYGWSFRRITVIFQLQAYNIIPFKRMFT